MTRICLVVTNGCAPDPRVERHARWLVELGHNVTIFAWDREHTFDTKSNEMDTLFSELEQREQHLHSVLFVRKRSFFDHKGSI